MSPTNKSTSKIDFAILSAMPEEQEYYHKFFSGQKCTILNIHEFEFKVYNYNGKQILLASTGLGTTFAASIVTLIHDYFHPDYVFLTGTAGGIKSGLKLRDVIIIDKAFEAEIQGAFSILKGTPFEGCLRHPLKNKIFPSTYTADEELLAIASSIDVPNITIQHGTAVSSNTFPAPQELFDRIKSQNPSAIDMETSAIYQVAWLLKFPVLAIRGISNVLNQDGSDDKIHESDIAGSAEAAAKVLLKIVDALLLKLDLKKSHVEEAKSAGSSEAEIEASEIITSLALKPHPEGGYYSQVFKANNKVKSTDKSRYHDEERSAGTSIYYLLKGNDFSAWHKLKSDEIWHYYKGSPVKIYVINNKGILTTTLLGDPLKDPNAVFQLAIAAGDWFAAEPADKKSYSLVGCAVNPGFEFEDFELADRKALSALFPQHADAITQFTRVSPSNTEKSESKNNEKIRAHL